MSPTIVVGIPGEGDLTERVRVEASRVDRDRDGTVRLYDGDGTEIATFWDALYAVREDELEE